MFADGRGVCVTPSRTVPEIVITWDAETSTIRSSRNAER
jgi:hypothetical protein